MLFSSCLAAYSQIALTLVSVVVDGTPQPKIGMHISEDLALETAAKLLVEELRARDQISCEFDTSEVPATQFCHPHAPVNRNAFIFPNYPKTTVERTP